MSNSSFFKGKTTVELGCGAALSSIAVGKLVGVGGGATSSVVIATDNNPEVLNLAKRNIERNDLSGVVTTAMLQWGSMAAVDYENSADVVIGSDLTYNSGSWVALAETMSIILKPGGIVIYLVSVDFLLKRASFRRVQSSPP
jgi:predicted nicotinamide N-methyase